MVDTPAKVSSLQVHTTDRATFRSCRLRWHFSSNLRLNLKPERTPQALLFGSAIHSGLEAYYKNDRDFPAAVNALTGYLLEWFGWETDGGDEATEELNELTELGVQMLAHYDRVYKDDGLKVELVEQKFELRLDDCPYCTKGQTIYYGVVGPCHKCDGTGDLIYSFQIDGLVKDSQGRFWILEHKTASRIEDDTDYLQIDDQCGSYLWGVQKTLGGKIEGVIYNTLLKQAPKALKRTTNGMFSVDKRQLTTYAIAKEQLSLEFGNKPIPDHYQDYLDYLMIQSPPMTDPLNHQDKFFRRVAVRRSQAEIESEGNTIGLEVADMLDPKLKIYRNPNRFNCGGCPFKAPCIAYYAGGDVELILKGSYVSRD